MFSSTFSNFGEKLKEFQITYSEDSFIEAVLFEVSDYFRQDLELMMTEGVVNNSERAICENLIYPVLKEVWKQYRQHFVLWSHQFLSADAELSEFPEYALAKRSPLGKVVFDKPYFLLVEAKQDNFEGAWAQCLSEMIAAQRINDNPDITVFGIASNGNLWEFGQLKGSTFTSNPSFYTIQDLDQLFAAINYIFQRCEQQVQELVAV